MVFLLSASLCTLAAVKHRGICMSRQENVFSRLIKFVELSTKLISLTPFLIGVAYSLYLQGSIQAGYTVLLFFAVILWDMTVTMINNFIDKRREGGTPHFSTSTSLLLIFGAGGISMLLGLWLTALCGLPVLLAGVICFGIGILYSFGPTAISRTPYGEVASGLTMGFFIIFLAVFVNTPARAAQYADIRFDGSILQITMHWLNLLYLVLLSLPSILCTSNIMLANNICDMERDAANKRYTLPYYIGRSNALRLFQLSVIVSYLAIIALVVLGVLHPVSLAALLTAPIVWKNVRRFVANPVKSETFILSVKIYTILLFGLVFTIFAGFFLESIL